MIDRADYDKMLRTISSRPRMYCGTIETGRDLIFFLRGVSVAAVYPRTLPRAIAMIKRRFLHFATMSIVGFSECHLGLVIGEQESLKVFFSRSLAKGHLVRCTSPSASYSGEFRTR